MKITQKMWCLKFARNAMFFFSNVSNNNNETYKSDYIN